MINKPIPYPITTGKITHALTMPLAKLLVLELYLLHLTPNYKFIKLPKFGTNALSILLVLI